MGVTFKENCPDIRNSKVLDIIQSFKNFEANITILDPHANLEQVKKTVGIDSVCSILKNKSGFDAIILAVAHDIFKQIDIRKLKKASGVIYDVKGFLPRTLIDGSL